ncbi:MAG: tetraacyldisaccharide 4'-kinase [Gammaproteobacteria bacterium]|nr:tetraacyldisaccharide 4'-kinase [Gammaproteobacteria bacterium]
MNLRPRRRDDPELNLVPMIDVVLVLLIFFMIATSLRHESELEIRLPEASGPPMPGDVAPLEVSIDAEGRYAVHGVPRKSITGLDSRFGRIAGGPPTSVPWSISTIENQRRWPNPAPSGGDGAGSRRPTGFEAGGYRHHERRAHHRATAVRHQPVADALTMNWLDRHGYSLNLVAVLLWPLSLLFGVAVRGRRLLYKHGLLHSEAVGAPVVVVGNISVGGTGKTPLVARLVELLRETGYKPGIVSRGYGGQSAEWPRHVTVDSDPSQVGDEPVMLARRCRCPIVVDPDRVAAARVLLETYDCNVVLSDDGLQHYRLRRDIEIAVVDGLRRLGNGACLPAGPLREPPSRLQKVDFVIGNGAASDNEYLMSLRGETALNLVDPLVSVTLAGFRKSTVHAVAGVGNPRRFFNYLRHARLHLIEHPFPDHYFFGLKDLRFPQDLPVLMTEKDAIKCRAFASEDWWYVPVNAHLDPEFEEELLKRLATVAMSKGIQRKQISRRLRNESRQSR